MVVVSVAVLLAVLGSNTSSVRVTVAVFDKVPEAVGESVPVTV